MKSAPLRYRVIVGDVDVDTLTVRRGGVVHSFAGDAGVFLRYYAVPRPVGELDDVLSRAGADPFAVVRSMRECGLIVELATELASGTSDLSTIAVVLRAREDGNAVWLGMPDIIDAEIAVHVAATCTAAGMSLNEAISAVARQRRVAPGVVRSAILVQLPVMLMSGTVYLEAAAR